MYIATVTRNYYCYDDELVTTSTIECATAKEAFDVDEDLFYESECCDTCYSTSWKWNDDSFICTLTEEKQEEIRNALVDIGLSDEDIELAMNGRVCDLEEIEGLW